MSTHVQHNHGHDHNHDPAHTETHFYSPEILRDIVIGMSDGLTVPFALAAGLAGAVSANKIIITAGTAEIIAGSIAMGLGGYLAARSDSDHYFRERTREKKEVLEIPDHEEKEIYEIFNNYGLKNKNVETLVKALRRDPDTWVDFMMRFELGLEKPNPKRARNSAITIAASYVVGGLVPLGPYVFLQSSRQALSVSVVITLAALFVFGYVKGRLSNPHPFKSAIQTTLIGGVAATAAYFLAMLVKG